METQEFFTYKSNKISEEELQEEILRLKEGTAEYERVIMNLKRSNNRIEDMKSNITLVDRETTGLIDNIKSSFECGGVEKSIAPNLVGMGTGRSHMVNKAYDNLDNQIRDIQCEIQKKENRIKELETEIEMRRSLKIF